MKTVVVAAALLLAALPGCTPPLDFGCRAGVAYLNGKKFDCDVCNEELGCIRESGGWRCPGYLTLSCSYSSRGGSQCCSGECIDCGAP